MNKTIKGIFYFIMVCIAVVYAAPNFYPKDPAVTIVSKNNTVILPEDVKIIENNKTKIGYESVDISESEVVVKFATIENQMKGYETVSSLISDDYYKNLNLVSSHPDFLDTFGAKSASLGLDLRGGVHFLMEVDSEDAIKRSVLNAKNSIESEVDGIVIDQNELSISSSHPEFESKLAPFNQKLVSQFVIVTADDGITTATLTDAYKKSLSDSIVKQNIITLKNRVNEIGVAEPVVQREGSNRIIVQLPGIQDTQKAKEIIGATATLDFKGVSPIATDKTEAIRSLDGQMYNFFKKSIISGETITDASTGFDPQTSAPLVSVELDSVGGNQMLKYTSENKGQLMGSVLKTTIYNTKIDENGNEYKEKTIIKEAINVARIQGVFSTRFQISGVDDKNEAHKLAILLRSGALAAPIEIIEEKTIGPNLGAENIEKGKLSIGIGFILVLILMAIRYKTLGMIANFCVLINMMALLSILSILGATLTLPGIAGIILTVGMAVDANVIIFERIKEEYSRKGDVKKSIKNGYNKALSSVVDANVTTLIAAIVLFAFGSGAVKGFSVTLLIGIITSLLTSIYLSRFIVETVYKNKTEIKL